MKNQDGEIQYDNLLRWNLPTFDEDDVSLFDWQAARMRNYIKKMVREKTYTPQHFRKGKEITGDNVAKFYGALIAKIRSGNPSINQHMLSTREIFDACEPVRRSMTLNTMKDMTRCLHFVDD